VLPPEIRSSVPWERNSISPACLRAALEYLSEYRIVALAEAIDFLLSGNGTRGRRKAYVAITFDDGYADFYHYAFPILEEMGVPATLFVTTGPVEGRESLWWDEVSMRIWYQPDQSLNAIASLKQADPFRLAVGKFAQSRDLSDWQAVRDIIRGIPLCERERLRKAIEGNVPSTGAEMLIDMLTPEMIREISGAGISVQAHTVSHAHLDELGREELEKELVECKMKLESWTGHKVEFLAYPAGRIPGSEGMEFIRTHFRAAVTTRPGNNRRGEDLHRLKRKDIQYLLTNGRFQKELARMEVGGMLDALLARAE